MNRLPEQHDDPEVTHVVDLLSETAADPDPIRQFEAWYADAVAADLPQPDAMTLATVSSEGRPSARMVLLKQADQRGFVFFTNYDSRKGRELAANPNVALVLYWNALHRQVRIEGTVERLTPAESDDYFATRPHGSQIAAIASRQSEPIESRAVLENRVQELEEVYGAGEVPRPDYWGGYRVMPSLIEFWQGRPNRLHDRLRYCREQDRTWTIVRLSP